MSTNINAQTLYTLNYSNITQLVEDLNRNFAIIQNSPLFKGIPGKPGDIGNPGPIGTRGTKIFFVNLDTFIEKFPGEIRIGSDITVDYLQIKLDGFLTKQILLDIWGITEFVNQDIIVLTNSTMIQYVNGTLVNTGVSFNEETTILSTIEKTIETKVKYYVENNPIILGIKNVFDTYQTYYKNYADTNNVHINNSLLKSSIIAPYIPGYSNDVGIKADANDGLKKDHTYFGFSDNLFNIYKSGTVVFGSMANYAQLLLNSISTSQQGTLTSDYAPGVNNMPVAIFLQEDENSGLLIGKRTDSSLMRFGSIYKDNDNSLIIKSDSSKNPNEYSAIELNKNQMVYRKPVFFYDNLTVGGKFFLSGDIQSPYIKTGTEIYPAGSGIVSGPKKLQLGYRDVENGTIPSDAVIDLITKNIYLSHLTTTNSGKTVLTTEQTTGKVLTTYSIDTRIPNANEYIGITKYTMFNTPKDNVDKNWIVTANQLFGIQSKINGLIDYITDASTGYWRKNQYDTGEIPSIQIGTHFKINPDSSIFIGGIDTSNSWLSKIPSDVNIVNFGFAVPKDSRLNLKFDSVYLEEYTAGLVLVTEDGGLISKKYTIYDNTDLKEVTGFAVNTNDNFKFLNKTHFRYLLAYTKQEITKLDNSVNTNFWTKEQFKAAKPVIPTIRLINDLYSDSFKINGNNLELGRATLTGKIQLLNQLELTTTHGISVPKWSTTTPAGDDKWTHKAVGVQNNLITELEWRFPNIVDIRTSTIKNMADMVYVTTGAWNSDVKQSILQSRVLSENWWWWLFDKTDKLYQILKINRDDNNVTINDPKWNFWTKADFANSTDRPIPALYLSGILDTSGSVFNFGPLTNRLIQGNGVSLILGRSDGTVTLRNKVEYTRHKQTFILTKADGIVDDLQRIPVTTYPDTPDVTPEAPYSKDDTMTERNNNWSVNQTRDGLINVPNEQQILTIKWAEWIQKFMNSVKGALKRIYSAARTENRISTRLYEHLPVGSIIAFSPYIDIPTGIAYEQWGWAICNGTPVTRQSILYNTPDLRDRFVRAVGTQTEAGKASPTSQDAAALGITLAQLENNVYIKGSELPTHQHNIIINNMSSSEPYNKYNISLNHAHDLTGVAGAKKLWGPLITMIGSDNDNGGSYRNNYPNDLLNFELHKAHKRGGHRKRCVFFNYRPAPTSTSAGLSEVHIGHRVNGFNKAVNEVNKNYNGMEVVSNLAQTSPYYGTVNIDHKHTISPSGVSGPTTRTGVPFKLYIKQFTLVYLMKVPKNIKSTDTIVTGYNKTTNQNTVQTIDTIW